MGLKDKCTPPKKGVQPKGKARIQHYEQHRKCKPRAPQSGDSDLEVEPRKRVHHGKTASSLGRLNNRLHPLHNCDLLRVQPYTFHAKHKSEKPKSLKPKEAIVTAKGEDDITARAGPNEMLDRVIFESVCEISQDIDTCEQLAANSAGMEDEPEDEDIFGSCGM